MKISTDVIFAVMCVLCALTVAVYIFTREKRFKAMILSVMTGLFALFILNYFGDKLKVNVPLNTFDVCGSMVLGVPFLIGVILINSI